jgi:IclR family acetate operon transcriptional repressor
MAIPDGDAVVLIERLETSKPLRIVLPLGMRLSLHASAQGKSVLAASPAGVAEQLLADGLPKYTGTTITDPEALRAELEEIRARGYAANGGEWRSDVSAVAAAVTDASGHPAASISISVPTSRITAADQAAYGALVAAAAAAVSDKIKGA